MDRAARWLHHTAPATTPGRSRRSGLRWWRPGGRGHAARRATGSGTRRWGVAPREAAASPHGGAERKRPPAPPPPFRSTRPPAPAHGGNGNGGPALRTRRRAESSRLLRWFQHAAAETGTASSGARGSHRRPVHGERQKAARWRGDRTAPPLHTAAPATAAATRTGAASSSAQQQRQTPGERRPRPPGNGGPTAATAVSRSDTQRPGERRTADQTGNSGTNRAAHRDPDRQQEQRTAGDSPD